ncbi:MAG: hypothetical protein F2534_02285 [Actinobacteria bacterium]|uniref:Unannotated protein n=1 Tax=freshwater metagenome TaxID=449393 RepID=A0A6J6BX55_9ZZZZ|nr:hypothetical protein [Actinomycetota bacterium]
MLERGDTTTEPIEDVLTGIDAVVARGGADRVGVLGHGAGAVLALQLHARHRDRFRIRLPDNQRDLLAVVTVFADRHLVDR